MIAYSSPGVIERLLRSTNPQRPETIVLAGSGWPISPRRPGLPAGGASRACLARMGDGRACRRRPWQLGRRPGDRRAQASIEASPFALAPWSPSANSTPTRSHLVLPRRRGALPAALHRDARRDAGGGASSRPRRSPTPPPGRRPRRSRQAAQARSEFVANMSHEIRTPSTPSLGSPRWGSGTALGQTRQQFIRIVESGQHLLGIVNDVLDSAKIEAGKLSVEQIAIDPGQVIDSAITLSAERAFARGLDLRVREKAACLPAAWGDPCDSPRSSSTCWATPSSSPSAAAASPRGPRRPATLHLSVSDTGIGMSPRADRAPLRALRAGRQLDHPALRRHRPGALDQRPPWSARWAGASRWSSHPGAGTTLREPALVEPLHEFPPPAAASCWPVFRPTSARGAATDLTAGIAVTTVEAPARPGPGGRSRRRRCPLRGDLQAWRDWLACLHAERRSLAIAGRLDEIERAAELPGCTCPSSSARCAAAFLRRLWPAAPGPARPALETRLAGLRVLASTTTDQPALSCWLPTCWPRRVPVPARLHMRRWPTCHRRAGQRRLHCPHRSRCPTWTATPLTLLLQAAAPGCPPRPAHRQPEARDACLAACAPICPNPLELGRPGPRDILEHASADARAARVAPLPPMGLSPLSGAGQQTSCAHSPSPGW